VEYIGSRVTLCWRIFGPRHAVSPITIYAAADAAHFIAAKKINCDFHFRRLDGLDLTLAPAIKSGASALMVCPRADF